MTWPELRPRATEVGSQLLTIWATCMAILLYLMCNAAWCYWNNFSENITSYSVFCPVWYNFFSVLCRTWVITITILKCYAFPKVVCDINAYGICLLWNIYMCYWTWNSTSFFFFMGCWLWPNVCCHSLLIPDLFRSLLRTLKEDILHCWFVYMLTCVLCFGGIPPMPILQQHKRCMSPFITSENGYRQEFMWYWNS